MVIAAVAVALGTCAAVVVMVRASRRRACRRREDAEWADATTAAHLHLKRALAAARRRDSLRRWRKLAAAGFFRRSQR